MYRRRIGRPKKRGKGTVVVSISLDADLIETIDTIAPNRSDFIAKAIRYYLDILDNPIGYYSVLCNTLKNELNAICLAKKRELIYWGTKANLEYEKMEKDYENIVVETIDNTVAEHVVETEIVKLDEEKGTAVFKHKYPGGVEKIEEGEVEIKTTSSAPGVRESGTTARD